MGSDEGGLEELVELSWRRAWRSRSWASKSAIRSWRDFQASRRAAWASGGTVFQSGSGIGGWWFIHQYYELAVQKVRGVNGYDVPGLTNVCRAIATRPFS